MKKRILTTLLSSVLSLALLFGADRPAGSLPGMQNILNRNRISLNGSWSVLPDASSLGTPRHWEKISTPRDKQHLVELNYDGYYQLNVPGDWNSQELEFKYYQGDIWYKRDFTFEAKEGCRTFLHFGAVSQNCAVFLNGKPLGTHKGGFTPFQFEITGQVQPGENYLVLRVDNKLSPTGIPAVHFDWWNYGGITRDVDLVYVPQTYIDDYSVQLVKDSMKEICVKVRLDGKERAGQTIRITIPEARIQKKMTTDANGEATLKFRAGLDLWSPEHPRLYDVTLSSGLDRITDRIGFRCIQVKGEDLYLNGEKIFLYGVNFHEEIAHQQRRAHSPEDARYLLQKAREVGANFIRLAHYPQNEYTVRMAEEMGFLLWEEIPLWQGIRFSDETVHQLAFGMLEEMIRRDRNRCAIIIWSISNETSPRDKYRNEFLPRLAGHARRLDNTRLISSALDAVYARKDGDGFAMSTGDPLCESLDVIGVNKYMGWYNPFPCAAESLNWKVSPGKPVLITEFGAEATYGNHNDPDDINGWSEEYMAKVFRDNIRSFQNPNNIRGIAPWILFDFRSPGRSNGLHQQGWNKKGILSINGDRKQAWYILHENYINRKFDHKIK